ncbi:hypothetical protein [Paenibacillus hexagrammi]|uniref:Uncharacterized protein n=1 Tax=Paenibacillus hexagrammi TaxID=2908839 RepID=A0ABY3SPD8_9BACL|nr:hypothetical protein [Paenibacillus sp. YPD9-1]UJF35816.1 hypothetical protein L0M14_12455 [Paenibacillus sp. YPD9-1]
MKAAATIYASIIATLILTFITIFMFSVIAAAKLFLFLLFCTTIQILWWQVCRLYEKSRRIWLTGGIASVGAAFLLMRLVIWFFVHSFTA